MKRLIAVLALTAWIAVVLAPAAEAVGCEKTTLLDIQDEVMCVICGVPLVNAGGPQSDDQRDFIRERVQKCESKEQIKAALVAEYTDAVLAVPKKSGFDLAAYVVPIIVLLAVLVAIVLGAIGWKRNSASAVPSAATADEDDELNTDLRRYDL
ncbi:MAG: cytochrome c-type biogenesis protein CcmH [Thermoleophilaceae bacterium]|nr:cytochrome c-type biogenesis protein CcmH [Thermoleophilaceae bacterium]